MRDVEVLHVEEAVFAHGPDELRSELLVTLRGAIRAEVESDEVGPVEVLLFSGTKRKCNHQLSRPEGAVMRGSGDTC